MWYDSAVDMRANETPVSDFSQFPTQRFIFFQCDNCKSVSKAGFPTVWKVPLKRIASSFHCAEGMFCWSRWMNRRPHVIFLPLSGQQRASYVTWCNPTSLRFSQPQLILTASKSGIKKRIRSYSQDPRAAVFFVCFIIEVLFHSDWD